MTVRKLQSTYLFLVALIGVVSAFVFAAHFRTLASAFCGLGIYIVLIGVGAVVHGVGEVIAEGK